MVMLIQVFATGVGATEGNDILISKYTQSVDSIKTNDTFTINGFIKNISDNDIKNVYAVINQNASFSVVSGQNIIVNIKDIPSGNNDDVTFTTPKLRYSGTGNELSITFKYKYNDNTSGESTCTLYLNTVPKSDNTDSNTFPDLDYFKKLDPEISLFGNINMPTGTAGRSISLSLPIKNISSYAAENIVVSLSASGENSPFVFKTIKPSYNIDKIFSGKTVDAKFDLDIAPNAKAGIYTLNISYRYANGMGGVFTKDNADTIQVKVENNSTPPRLNLSKIERNPQTMEQGKTGKLRLSIQNGGNTDAKNVKVQLSGLSSEGFTIANGTDVKYINNIASYGTGIVEYNLACAKGMPSGNHPLNLDIAYKDEAGGEYTEKLSFFIPVYKSGEQGAGDANILIQNVKSPNGVVKVGQDFSIGFDVVNKGGAEARNTKISISSEAGIINKTLNTVMLSSLKPNERKHLDFVMSSTGEVTTKNYPIAINIEQDKNSATQYVGVYIENPEKGSEGGEQGDPSIPKLIVDQYSFEDSNVKAGHEANLELSFLNTSQKEVVRNLKITFMSDDGTFTTVGTNTFFVDSIAPGKSIKKQIKLAVKPDAEPKVYPISIKFDYEYDKNKTAEGQEMISIPVEQEQRLVLGDVNIPPDVIVGQPVPLFIEFYNMGKSVLYNLMVRVDGDFEGQKPTYFVGNFEPGRSDSFDGTITPTMPGELQGKIIFSFEDAAGNQMEMEKEFSMDIGEMPPPPMEGEEGMGEVEDDHNTKFYKKITPWQWALICVGIAGIIIGIIIIRKKRLKKKGAMFDEFT
jgi:hypothetical protein